MPLRTFTVDIEKGNDVRSFTGESPVEALQQAEDYLEAQPIIEGARYTLSLVFFAVEHLENGPLTAMEKSLKSAETSTVKKLASGSADLLDLQNFSQDVLMAENDIANVHQKPAAGPQLTRRIRLSTAECLADLRNRAEKILKTIEVQN